VQETVIWYDVLPVFPFAGPTTKEPYTVEPNTCATAPVTTLAMGPLIEQGVPSGTVGVTPVAVTSITSPYFPLIEVRVIERVAPAFAFSGG